MKHLLWGTFATALLACGGGAKPATTPPPEPVKRACAGAAENMVGLVTALAATEYTEDQRPELVRVLTTRCEADAWSDDAVACMTTMTSAEDELVRCGQMLTEAQRDAVDDQMDREVPRRGREGDLEESDKAMDARPDDPCGGGA